MYIFTRELESYNVYLFIYLYIYICVYTFLLYEYPTMSPIRIISALVGAVFTKEARHIGMDGCIICSEPLGDNTGETSQW